MILGKNDNNISMIVKTRKKEEGKRANSFLPCRSLKRWCLSFGTSEYYIKQV